MKHLIVSRTRFLSGMALCALLLSMWGEIASAASTWNPTTLVNTESFQTIDEGDSTTNIEIRFGQTLGEKLFYDRTNGRFEFSKGLVINGDTKVRGNLSGSTLTIDGLRGCDSIDTDANGNAVCGTDSGITQTNADARYVNTSGDTMTGALKISNGAGLNASGSIVTNTNITLNSDNEAADAVLTFGNATAAQTLKYSHANQRFEFSKDIRVTGSISASANLSGATLRIDHNADIWGNISGSGTLKIGGATTLNGATTITGNTKVRANLSGSTLRIDGNADVHGALTASGGVRTDGDLTINDDQTATDAILTFGQPTTNQTLKYLNASGKFQFSRGLSVLGTLSGSVVHADTQLQSSGSLIVEGNMSGATLEGAGLGTCNGSTQKLLYNPTTKKFECGTDLNAIGNSSGNILSFHPSYPNAVYFASGSTMVGQLTGTGGSASLENLYRWTSTKSTIQDYWIGIRVRVPNNFGSWDTVKPIELRYRTSDGTATNNHVTVRMKDTTGATVALGSAGALTNAAYTTANITGPETSGTFTPKGYFTVYIKMAAKTGGFAEAGYINFNYETTTP